VEASDFTPALICNYTTTTAATLDQGGGKRRAVTLCCVVKSRAGSPVGEPLAIFGDRKILLAALANRLGRRANAMAEDFVDHFAGRAEIEKVVHYRSASLRQNQCFRLPRAQGPRQLLASSPAAFLGRGFRPHYGKEEEQEIEIEGHVSLI
jgi:hypothetical protein